MDAMVTVLLLATLGAIVATPIAYAMTHGRESVAVVFGLDHEPGWPRCVQEDDSPPPWRLDALRRTG